MRNLGISLLSIILMLLCAHAADWELHRPSTLFGCFITFWLYESIWSRNAKKHDRISEGRP